MTCRNPIWLHFLTQSPDCDGNGSWMVKLVCVHSLTKRRNEMSEGSESIGDLISRGQEFESSEGRRPMFHSEDHESKSSGGTGSNTSRANNVDPAMLQLGAKETKIIRNSKVCVYIFLILIAIIFSIATWFFVSSVEQTWVAQQVGQCRSLIENVH